MPKENRKKKSPRKPSAGKHNRRDYRQGQRSASIYFLLWTIFAAFSLVIVFVFGITQRTLMTKTYKDEARRELAAKGGQVSDEIEGLNNSGFQGDYNFFVQMLSKKYGVQVFILNTDGEVLVPYSNVADDPAYSGDYDFSGEMKRMLSKMSDEESKTVVFIYGNNCIYGEKIEKYGQTDTYLYVGKSMNVAMAALSRMQTRMLLISAFVLVLTFAAASAVSGWLTRPIAEMTGKARLLAEGDFDVDFHGREYGSEMAELADALNFARDELSKTDRMQKELIANVSHDFKTPLTMIKGYASMIMEISGDIPEKRNKHAQVIVDEADRLASLVSDVLDLSKLQSGIQNLEEDLLDMSAYVKEILERFTYLQETQGYLFEQDIEEGLYTKADKLKIGQVLYNLIGNAVNYTGEDKRVLVRLKKDEKDVFRFSVSDTGVGIKSEELDTVWDRYYRSSETHKRPVKGTGLGLSIVKAILQRHGYKFGIESTVGKGSTFFIDFPLVGEAVTEENE